MKGLPGVRDVTDMKFPLPRNAHQVKRDSVQMRYPAYYDFITTALDDS